MKKQHGFIAGFVSVVSLPPSAILFATGLLGLGAAGRRRKKAAL